VRAAAEQLDAHERRRRARERRVEHSAQPRERRRAEHAQLVA
jgi:hypothetical protein